MPVVSKATTLTLAMQEAEVVEDCYTKQGLTLGVQAVIAFKVGDDHESIAAAARRFQGDQRQMPTLVGRIFSGHLRSIIGSMTVEAIIREQQTLADAILDASKGEMGKIGLAVDSLQISSIDDKGVRLHRGARRAAPGRGQPGRARSPRPPPTRPARWPSRRARATRPSTPGRPPIARAQYQAEIDQAEQKAAQAGPLAAAQAQQAVLAERALVAQKNAELREAELIAEVRQAGARPRPSGSSRWPGRRPTPPSCRPRPPPPQGRIALDQQVIEQLPEMLLAAAQGLQGANLTVLNGADGLGGVVASLAGQGMALLDSVRNGLGGYVGDAFQPSDADSPKATGPAALTDRPA